jgi:hypothetical protein
VRNGRGFPPLVPHFRHFVACRWPGAVRLPTLHSSAGKRRNQAKEKHMELIFAIALPVVMIIAINAFLQRASQVRFAA